MTMAFFLIGLRGRKRRRSVVLLQQHISCLISIWRVNGTVWQAVYSPVSLHLFLCAGTSPWIREEEGTDFKTLWPCLLKRANLRRRISIIYRPRCSYMVYGGICRHFALMLCFLQLYKRAYTIRLSQRPFHKHIKMMFD